MVEFILGFVFGELTLLLALLYFAWIKEIDG